MNMPLCVTKNILPEKRILLIAQVMLGIWCAVSLLFFQCNAATAQEKKPDAKAGTSIEEERLRILKADIQAQIEQLKKLKQEIAEVQKGLEGKRQEQFNKVVKMYESMSAEEAAKAIEKLDDDTAAQILSSMKPRSSGKIMGQLEPAKAATLSKKVLNRGKSL